MTFTYLDLPIESKWCYPIQKYLISVFHTAFKEPQMISRPRPHTKLLRRIRREKSVPKYSEVKSIVTKDVFVLTFFL